MTVLYDNGSELERSTSAVAKQWTHTATASNVVGVAVAIVRGVVSTDTVSAVSYGGIPLVRVNRATDTANEPGAAEWWVSQQIPPQGPQTVAYVSGTPASHIHAVALTFTGKGTLYAIGSGTKSENTVSSSVSLTTGYLAGIGLGAFYGGGTAPSAFTYGVDRTLVHDWDMGAFYTEVFRHTDTQPAGTGFPLAFGGDASTDDVAFAAIYVTDGVIDAASPQTAPATIAGQVPTLDLTLPAVEETRSPAQAVLATTGQTPLLLGQGLLSPLAAALALVPRAPETIGPRNTHEVTLWRELKRGVGLGGITIEGRQPALVPTLEVNASPSTGLLTLEGRAALLARDRLIAPGLGASSLEGRVPSVVPEGAIAPDLAALQLLGRQPTLVTEGAVELTVSPAVGVAAIAGTVPGEVTKRVITPALGASAIEGRIPALSAEGGAFVEPGQATATIAGLAPTLLTERVIVADVGAVGVEGLAPTFLTEAPVEQTIEPDVGLVTIEGRAPTLLAETAMRGHVGTRRRTRRGRAPVWEESESAIAAIVVTPAPELVPVPPAEFDPPATRLAGMDTRVTAIEARRLEAIEKRARQRREEEELLSILLRVA